MPFTSSLACTSLVKGGTSLLCCWKEGLGALGPRWGCSSASSACCGQVGGHCSGQARTCLWAPISWYQPVEGNFLSLNSSRGVGLLKSVKLQTQGALRPVGGNSARSTLQRLTLCFLTYKRCNLQKRPSFFSAITPGFWTNYERANNFQTGLSFPRISDDQRRSSALPQDEQATPTAAPSPAWAKTSQKHPVPFQHPGLGNPRLIFFPDSPLFTFTS